jgi:hypothetical protein
LDLIWNNTIPIEVNVSDSIVNVTRNFNLTVTFSPTDVVRIDGYASLTLERPSAKDDWRITRWRDESNF